MHISWKGSAQPGTVHSVASQSPRKEACYRCGRTNHKASNCKFKEAVCPNCGKRGNLKRRCKQPQRGDKRGNSHVEEREKKPSGWTQNGSWGRPRWILCDQKVVKPPSPGGAPAWWQPCNHGRGYRGNDVTYLGAETTESSTHHNTVAVLQTYTSERIPVRGELQVMVEYGDQKKRLSLYVTKGDVPCIMGQEWLKSIWLENHWAGHNGCNWD